MAFILVVVAALALNADQAGHQIGRTLLAAPPSIDRSANFGEQVAAAALERTNHFVIYNPKYVQIKYPMGDVPSYFGVCSDVVIRTYRRLGIDLQKEVHESLGGDRNIAHRRVRVLRKFFARKGRRLPVTKNADDYKPGDLVTYDLPKGRFSNTHIAIVSARKTRHGRPLVIHNRGFGPQLEDWLFEEKITGHYRYWPGKG